MVSWLARSALIPLPRGRIPIGPLVVGFAFKKNNIKINRYDNY